MTPIDAFTWPLDRLGEGIEELARRTGLCRASEENLVPPSSIAAGHGTDLGRWIEWAGARLGIEAESVETTYAEIDALIQGAGPAVIALRGSQGLRFLLVMRPGHRRVRLLAPDLAVRSCPVGPIRDAVCAGLEAPLVREIDQLLERAQVPARKRERARRSMVVERLGAHPVGECWVLRPAPAASFLGQLTQARLPRRVWGMLGLFAAAYLLEILGWGLMGDAALNGRLDMGWLGAWVLLLVTLVPLRLLAEWLDATFALDAGRVLKKRLLAGALNLDIEAVRHQGAGRLLGRVMESQALESLALNGGLTVLVAALELAFAVSILAIGAGGGLHLILAAVWTLLTIGLSLRYHRRLRGWILMRLAMTHDLIEQMVGHRTRLAQEWPQHRGQSEDQTLKEYLDRSRQLDGAVIPIAVVMPTGWTLLGLLGLAPAFVAGTAEAGSLAFGLGGILLANRAFSGISGGLAGLARAVIAWEQVAPLFRAGGVAGKPAAFLPSLDPASSPANGARDKLIDASQLVFRYRPEGEAVLRGVDLTVHHGDRILLEGSSGGGKSTLAALLVGLRKPESGLLLLNGLDRPTLGDNWHRLATEAPQFHENHILSGTLGFNLLMGRNWPASEEELLAARELCIELGLGPLLERMPAGMMQMVGETGWQLSHGERSRIFLARALLQDAQLTVLDESFAALDPETLRECLNCAFARARTLLVIAHP